jgi:diadenosine tetraphosphate (Ap4A) HIT family hydrolase
VSPHDYRRGREPEEPSQELIVSEALDYTCDVCGFSVENPVARLSASVVGLFPDRRLAGRCVLVLTEHHEHFETLPEDLAVRFMADSRRVGRAIRQVTGSGRLNYAMLGNQVAHLHMHVMPRGGGADSNPRVSAWELDEPEAPLPDADRSQLVARLREVLGRE